MLIIQRALLKKLTHSAGVGVLRTAQCEAQGAVFGKVKRCWYQLQNLIKVMSWEDATYIVVNNVLKHFNM
jgi:hypothetical protein